MPPPLAALKNKKLDRFVVRKTVLFLMNKSELFLLNVGLIPIKSPDTTSNHVRSISITKTVRSADLTPGPRSGVKSALRALLIAVNRSDTTSNLEPTVFFRQLFSSTLTYQQPAAYVLHEL